MYAIVEIAGQQFKVAKDQKVFVHRLEEKEGSKVSFDKVLLLRRWKSNYWRPGYRKCSSYCKEFWVILKVIK